MIIDSHTHVGRNNVITANVKQLLTSMDESGIDKSLVIAGKMNDAANEWTLEQIEPYRDRLLGVGAAHPVSSQNLKDIDAEIKNLVEWYKSGQIVGCKFYVGYDHYYPFDDVVKDYLSALNDIGCPALFHSGDCVNTANCAKLKYAHPLHIDDVAVDYPNINFIIAHCGFPWVKDAAEVCYKNKNVFADTSGFVYGKFSNDDMAKFKSMINEFSQINEKESWKDKLLFGTDWPISDQKSYVDLFNSAYIRLPLLDLTKTTIKAFKLNEKV